MVGCHKLIRQLHAELQATQEQAEISCAVMQSRITDLEALLAEQRKTILAQEEVVEKLSSDNELLKRDLFGSRRERFTDNLNDPEQKLLFDAQTLEPATEVKAEPAFETERQKKRTSQGRQKRVFPEFLPREEERFTLSEAAIPEEMRNNPNARRFFRKIGERLELVPMQLKVVEQLQEVIAVDQPDESALVVSATKPASLIRSFVGPSVWAYLTVTRFADHLPYYRIEDILGRSGFRIDRGTQCRWMRGLAKGITPLFDLMCSRALNSKVLAVDETPVRELALGGCKKGYIWTAVGDTAHPYDCFFYTSDRCSIGPETFLKGFKGYLLGDAYVAYERIGRLWPGVVKASCWAHARRKFEACHFLGATTATCKAMAYFRQLFDMEDHFHQLNNEQRLQARREKVQPLVEDFHQWLEHQHHGQLPKAKLLGAINYMLNRWESFTRFLESGAVAIDSNLAERTLKYPILGRKAWLFVGNHDAGETATKLYTLTKTCNRHRIDPFAYLQDVYARLPTMSEDELPELLPDRWIQEHPQHLIQERVQESLDRARRAREHRAYRRALRDAG